MNTIRWEQLTVGVAAILGLIFVVRSQIKLVDRVMTFLGNHLSSVTRAQEDTASAMSDVAVAMGALKDSTVETRLEVKDGIHQLHEDNVEAAKVLKQSDSDIQKLVRLHKAETHAKQP